MTGTLLFMAYNNLDYKGYERVQGCYGECYEEYVRVHGTVVEQLQDSTSSTKSLLKTLLVRLEDYGISVVRMSQWIKVVWVHF